jgi:hypothetical protein
MLILQPRWFSGIIRPSGSSIRESNQVSKIGRGPAFDSRLGPFCVSFGVFSIVVCLKMIEISILWWSCSFRGERRGQSGESTYEFVRNDQIHVPNSLFLSVPFFGSEAMIYDGVVAGFGSEVRVTCAAAAPGLVAAEKSFTRRKEHHRAGHFTGILSYSTSFTSFC